MVRMRSPYQNFSSFLLFLSSVYLMLITRFPLLSSFSLLCNYTSVYTLSRLLLRFFLSKSLLKDGKPENHGKVDLMERAGYNSTLRNYRFPFYTFLSLSMALSYLSFLSWPNNVAKQILHLAKHLNPYFSFLVFAFSNSCSLFANSS